MRAGRRRDGDGREGAQRARLLAIYAEVDRLLAPFSCDASTDCCRFGITGREPYVTDVEVTELRRAAAASPQPRRSRLPVAGERACPLLGPDGRCTAYAARPFGCRTFFCQRVTGPGRPDRRGAARLPREEIQRLARELATLSAEVSPSEPHPRPLTRAL